MLSCHQLFLAAVTYAKNHQPWDHLTGWGVWGALREPSPPQSKCTVLGPGVPDRPPWIRNMRCGGDFILCPHSGSSLQTQPVAACYLPPFLPIANSHSRGPPCRKGLVAERGQPSREGSSGESLLTCLQWLYVPDIWFVHLFLPNETNNNAVSLQHFSRILMKASNSNHSSILWMLHHEGGNRETCDWNITQQKTVLACFNLTQFL